MAQYSKETITQVLSSTDVVDLIGSYIQLKRAGSQYRANCPFHNEKTPSFYVNPARQSFHCFGCGKGGDSIAFVRDYENLTFGEALQKLASRAGIVLREEDADDPTAALRRRSRGRLLDLHREAADFFHQQLLRNPNAAHARDYLKSRGYDRAMAERWAVGWMPDDATSFLDWARSRKFTGRELVDGGLAYLREENQPSSGLRVRFRGRLMFPVRNEIGDVIAFSGRQLREDPNSGKYINSPETVLFRKSQVIFALDRAKKPILQEKSVLLCEGQFDVIACHEAGILHAVAPLGTAFTPEHAKLLRRYTGQVVVCYDADKAGLAATERAFLELAAAGHSVRVVTLADGDDPDSFLRKHGAEALRGRLAAAEDFFDFKLTRAKWLGQLDTPAGRTEVLKQCASQLGAMTDFAALENRIHAVATYLQTSGNTLREEITRQKKRAAQAPKRSVLQRETEPPATTQADPTPLHRTIGYLCGLALVSTQAQHFLGEQFETLHEAGRWLQGVPLLETILAGHPNPDDPAAVNAFLHSLPECDQLALIPYSRPESVPEDPVGAATEALALVSATVLHHRDAAVQAELKSQGLSTARMMELLEESKEISQLLRGVDKRLSFNDELPPAPIKRPENQPFRRGGFGAKRRKDG